jgi:hypothetical protein
MNEEESTLTQTDRYRLQAVKEDGVIYLDLDRFEDGGWRFEQRFQVTPEAIEALAYLEYA